MSLHRIAFVGSYVPRRCGIATYTCDLHDALAALLPEADCLVVPVTDAGATHDYPAEARFEIPEDEPEAYRRAAAYLNLLGVDVVSLQHEFGIFGGPAGASVVALLQELRVPVHTTLHTVPARPTAEQRGVLADVIRLSARITVLGDRGRVLLGEVYGAPAARIDTIPHGIPDADLVDPAACKAGRGLAGRDVLLTFGLLSPNKGIEEVIAALPAIRARHPRVAYVVLGATHPHLLRREGERYRDRLVALAAELGVAEHVVFHDRFVDLPELRGFLQAADIYVTPYRHEDQVTSGTLAYAFGCGKPVVSTPYWHARELLGDGRGLLVPFRDPPALTAALVGLLDDPARRRELATRAHALGREMVWDRVALRYAESFRAARASAVPARRPLPQATDGAGTRPSRLPRHEPPPLLLDHLWTLTDETGLFQHATFEIPNAADGYCTDDNARALALMVRTDELGLGTPRTARAAATFATFLGHAFVPATGRFRNLLGFDRRWLDEAGSDDCLGRAVLALGTCVGRARRATLQRWALGMFAPALEAVMATTSPRCWALAILGIHEYLRRLRGDRQALAVRRELTERLLGLRRAVASTDWPWPEDVLAYDNARLCEALVQSGRWGGHDGALAAGLDMLEWLCRVQRSPTGRFAPVGCHGFMRRGGEPAPFDQQPIEAHATVSACLAALEAVGDEVWLDRAWNAFDWFHGHNVLGLALCDPHTGACRDGLLEDRTNENRGAESTLAYLAALVELRGLSMPARPAADARPRSAAAAGPAPA